MCGCGINEPCYGCPCGCYHNPKYLAEHERYSKSRRAVYRVRELHRNIDGYCSGCDTPTEYPCETIEALDGEK